MCQTLGKALNRLCTGGFRQEHQLIQELIYLALCLILGDNADNDGSFLFLYDLFLLNQVISEFEANLHRIYSLRHFFLHLPDPKQPFRYHV